MVIFDKNIYVIALTLGKNIKKKKNITLRCGHFVMYMYIFYSAES